MRKQQEYQEGDIFNNQFINKDRMNKNILISCDLTQNNSNLAALTH